MKLLAVVVACLDVAHSWRVLYPSARATKTVFMTI